MTVEVFTPSANSSKQLLQRMGSALASSLRHIFEQSEDWLQIDRAAKQALLQRLGNASRECPTLYALHFRLIDQINADELMVAQATINRILSLPCAAAGTQVMSLGAADAAAELSVIIPFFAESEDARFTFVKPDEAQAAPAVRQIDDALQLLKKGAPAFHAEISEIIPWIVIAAGEPTGINTNSRSSFGGASAMRAFGAVLLNAALQGTVFERALSLVHESSHNLLFAHAPKDGVVTNSPTELYSSPLRPDPRPMEGIHHATFVLARMALVAKYLLQSGLLSQVENELARKTITNARARFADGLHTLDEHAAYTPSGAQSIAEARAFMNSLQQ